MIPLPCTCSTAAEAQQKNCARAGVPMTGRLYELCSGNCPAERPCKPEDSEAYRRLWDEQELLPKKASVVEVPAPSSGGSAVEPLPANGWQTAWNGLSALARAGKQLVTGNPLFVSDDVYQQRVDICQTCEHLQENTCRLCGCPVRGEIRSKARLVTESCPLGKWSALPPVIPSAPDASPSL